MRELSERYAAHCFVESMRMNKPNEVNESLPPHTHTCRRTTNENGGWKRKLSICMSSFVVAHWEVCCVLLCVPILMGLECFWPTINTFYISHIHTWVCVCVRLCVFFILNSKSFHDRNFADSFLLFIHCPLQDCNCNW